MWVRVICRFIRCVLHEKKFTYHSGPNPWVSTKWRGFSLLHTDCYFQVFPYPTSEDRMSSSSASQGETQSPFVKAMPGDIQGRVYADISVARTICLIDNSPSHDRFYVGPSREKALSVKE